MLKNITIIFTLCTSLISSSLLSDVKNGEQLYQQRCALCHGTDALGNDSLNAPSLAAQKGWYIERQLRNFIDGTRGTNPKDIYGLQMRPMALSLSGKNDISDIADYLTSKTNKNLISTTLKNSGK